MIRVWGIFRKISRRGQELERKYMIKILYEDRKIIEEMYNSQMPINRIADRINVARSTLYRELRRGGVTEPSDLYSADLAQKNTKQRKWF